MPLKTKDFIALDWGTSSLRAFLMDTNGNELEERNSTHGIQHLPEPGAAGFLRALHEICGDWLVENTARPLVASGMVGSAQGWAEAPYAKCPADLNTLATQAGSVVLPDNRKLHIVPGVLLNSADALPDVMRGEETQIMGALAGQPVWTDNAVVVLPGTHSKWALVRQGTIERFTTYMTGEVFATLRQHSILGRLMQDAPATPDAANAAFKAGLEIAKAGQAGDLLNQLFTARSMGLTQRIEHSALSDYLSGMLIGNELVSAIAKMQLDQPQSPALLIIGNDTLVARYRQAFEIMGLTCAAHFNNTAPQGLYHFALERGLVKQMDK
ncbi:2-dehydro-3-deoxygalactonokinase [Halomonas colorata]|uniref:2-dehydro-3-deoxygalactonokinase n=1 Tax=Halomonas colorata TaxID=2742615 RepID=UPI0018689C4B|nr:2-dehydro-3-deoxygalactonokinase [Halomonas colorata]